MVYYSISRERSCSECSASTQDGKCLLCGARTIVETRTWLQLVSGDAGNANKQKLLGALLRLGVIINCASKFAEEL